MKKLISFALSSIIGLTGVTAINLINPTPVLAQLLDLRGGKAYNFETNRHGMIIRTFLGIFYLGKSKDAIREVNKKRYYGSWKKNYTSDHTAEVYVYIGNRTYIFDMYAQWADEL
jgi:hypothetical protein